MEARCGGPGSHVCVRVRSIRSQIATGVFDAGFESTIDTCRQYTCKQRLPVIERALVMPRRFCGRVHKNQIRYCLVRQCLNLRESWKPAGFLRWEQRTSAVRHPLRLRHLLARETSTKFGYRRRRGSVRQEIRSTACILRPQYPACLQRGRAIRPRDLLWPPGLRNRATPSSPDCCTPLRPCPCRPQTEACSLRPPEAVGPPPRDLMPPSQRGG